MSLEQDILDIFQSYLNKSITINDSYLSLGGDSLKAKSIIKEINTKYNIKLTVVNIFILDYFEDIIAKINELINSSNIIIK